jgi:hypothetical protein
MRIFVDSAFRLGDADAPQKLDRALPRLLLSDPLVAWMASTICQPTR